jgi:hypothetical protein
LLEQEALVHIERDDLDALQLGRQVGRLQRPGVAVEGLVAQCHQRRGLGGPRRDQGREKKECAADHGQRTNRQLASRRRAGIDGLVHGYRPGKGEQNPEVIGPYQQAAGDDEQQAASQGWRPLQDGQDANEGINHPI